MKVEQDRVLLVVLLVNNEVQPTLGRRIYIDPADPIKVSAINFENTPLLDYLCGIAYMYDLNFHAWL